MILSNTRIHTIRWNIPKATRAKAPMKIQPRSGGSRNLVTIGFLLRVPQGSIVGLTSVVQGLGSTKRFMGLSNI